MVEEEKRRDARARNDARGAERRMRRRLKRGAWEEPAGVTRGGWRPTPVRLREPGAKRPEGRAAEDRKKEAPIEQGADEAGCGCRAERKRQREAKGRVRGQDADADSTGKTPEPTAKCERRKPHAAEKTGRRSRESCCKEPCQLSVLSIHTDLTTDTLLKKISPFPK